jgi:aldehyde dehydrogenase (NAD+)
MVPAPVRGEAVRLVTAALRDYKDPLGSLVSMEMGKIKPEGDGEVQEMIDIGDFAVGQSRMMYGKTMHSERPGHRMYEQWHPLGVVGVTTAFNFPVAVWAWNALLSAICGNATVWKPSPKGALCCAAVQNIVNEALADTDYPPIFTSFMEPGPRTVRRFIDDERVALMSFTGSSQVGRLVGERVARRFGKSLLELGGNNAIIIDQTADLKLAIPAVVFGAVGTAGQRCTIHPPPVRARVDGRFGHRNLVKAYGQVRIGDPLDEKTLMGPLTDEQASSASSRRSSAPARPAAKFFAAASASNTKGFFVEPTIIRAENHWDIVQEETFAPILYVISYKTLEEAMAMHNDVKQGLSSAIFTTDMCAMPSTSCLIAARTAALPMSTSAPPARKSAAPLAAKRKPAAAANRARMPGRPTCAARPTPSTGQPNCRWPRASSSNYRKETGSGFRAEESICAPALKPES